MEAAAEDMKAVAEDSEAMEGPEVAEDTETTGDSEDLEAEASAAVEEAATCGVPTLDLAEVLARAAAEECLEDKAQCLAVDCLEMMAIVCPVEAAACLTVGEDGAVGAVGAVAAEEGDAGVCGNSTQAREEAGVKVAGAVKVLGANQAASLGPDQAAVSGADQAVVLGAGQAAV